MIAYQVICRFYDEAQPRGRSSNFGSHWDQAEAQAEMERQRERLTKLWSEGDAYHANRWFILAVDEIEQEGRFQIPPKFDWEYRHQRFTLSTAEKANKPGQWSSTVTTVYDNNMDGLGAVGTYTYHYHGAPPFEPFQQNGRFYALIAEDYTKTSVMDLQTGEVIAVEDDMPFIEGYEPGTPKGKEHGWRHEGFCPVGFYVPDWWDVHDDSILPGTLYWDDADHSWPDGTLGFVWGCQWGDDNGWKVQVLDLSRITEGIITRSERFGYLELDTNRDDPRKFIRVYSDRGRHVQLSIPKTYDLDTGRLMYE